jgi:hypothetical protein
LARVAPIAERERLLELRADVAHEGGLRMIGVQQATPPQQMRETRLMDRLRTAPVGRPTIADDDAVKRLAQQRRRLGKARARLNRIGGPAHVLQYLARYTHRVAISNHRINNVADGTVTFQWKDDRHGSQPRTMTVSAIESLRRFFLHVLPRGFSRIRFFGFLAHRRRAHDLPVCRRALESRPCQPVATPTVEKATPSAS